PDLLAGGGDEQRGVREQIGLGGIETLRPVDVLLAMRQVVLHGHGGGSFRVLVALTAAGRRLGQQDDGRGPANKQQRRESPACPVFRLRSCGRVRRRHLRSLLSYPSVAVRVP